jgi:lysophospholipase L1-like esterase
VLTAYNLGAPRQTSEEVGARWAGECASRLPAGADCRIVRSVGVHDTTEEDGHPRVPLEGSRRALAALLDGAAARQWPVLVVGPPPVADAGHNARTACTHRAFAEVCRATGVPYVAVLTTLTRSEPWMSGVAAGDGAHPGAAGYTELAALVRPAWSAWRG